MAPSREPTTRRRIFKRLFVRRSPRFKFGQPLQSVILDSDGIPLVLSKLRNVLWRGNGHQLEGIFRVSPSANSLKASRAMAEAGEFDKITDMESVAQLIKLWFKELPESILAPRMSDVVDGGVFSHCSECGKVYSRLPDLNKRVLRWLLELTGDICRHEKENRMTAQSISIVFAPNIVYPPDSMPPLLALELNKRVVVFIELLFEYWNLNSKNAEFASGQQVMNTP